MPPLLHAWNRWSIVIHFTLALIGVSAVRDSDPVAAHEILKLKTETARQDLETLRQAAELGNPFVLIAAKLRGLLDGLKLAREILIRGASAPVSVSGDGPTETHPRDELRLSIMPAQQILQELNGDTHTRDGLLLSSGEPLADKGVILGKPGRQ